jgi:hypothetical protein
MAERGTGDWSKICEQKRHNLHAWVLTAEIFNYNNFSDLI